MATLGSETAQLRTELRRLWGLVDVLIKALTGTLGAAGKVVDVLPEEVARLKEEVDALREENRNLECGVKMRERWNHAPSEATLMCEGPQEVQERGREVPGRGEGARIGMLPCRREAPSTSQESPGCRTTTSLATTESRLSPTRARSAAGQISSRSTIYRSWSGRLSGWRWMLLVFLYSITPGMCPDCDIRVPPHTDAIRGTSLGPKTRQACTSHKAGKNSVIEAVDIFKDVHHRKLSNRAVSNCMMAIAIDIGGEVMGIHSKSMVLEGGDGRPFRSPVRPPPEPLANRCDKHDSLLARYGIVWTWAAQRPVMVQILEKSTMEPWSRTDESRHRIGKKKVQALVYDTPYTTTVSIAKTGRRRPSTDMRRGWRAGPWCTTGTQHEAPRVAAAGAPPKRRGEGAPGAGVGPGGSPV